MLNRQGRPTQAGAASHEERATFTGITTGEKRKK